MSNRSEFLRKLADLMQEHSVVSIDAASNTEGDEYTIQFDFDFVGLLDTQQQWLYRSDVSKLASHFEVRDLLEDVK